MDSAVARPLTPSADQAPRAQPNEERKAPAATGTPDLTVVRAQWDDFRASVRRDKPVLATFVDKATPLRCTPSGALVLEVSDLLARESLEARLADLTALARAHFGGFTQVMLRESAVSPPSEPSTRMTPSSIRSDTMAALRKRDPVLNAAIDELDLELLD